MKSLVAILVFILPLVSRADVLNFDDLTDGTQLVTYHNVTFSNALVEAQGQSLSPLYPPASPPNVITNDPSGIMEISFPVNVSNLSAAFTYEEQVTIIGYDTMDNKVAQVMSQFSANYIGSGNPPNEIIELSTPAAAANIQFIQIFTTSMQSDTFTLDNLDYTTPEPRWVGLVGLVLIACYIGRAGSAPVSKIICALRRS